MNCAGNSAQKIASENLSRSEMMKIFASIDRTLIREAQRVDKSPTNISELDQVVTELLRADIPDSDVAAIASGNKVLIVPGAVTTEVSVKTGKVLEQSAKAAVSISSLPSREKVDTVMKNLRGPLAKTFVYSFIPSDSPVLAKYPEVARKRKIQIEAINDLSKEISFPVEYTKKHIRNAIVEGYNTNPEQVLHDIANGKDTELQSFYAESGLSGATGIDPALIAAVVSGAGSLVSLFKKESAPAKTDYPQQAQSQAQPQVIVIPAQQNVTKDPAYEKSDNTGLYIGLAIATVVAAGGAYALTH